VEDAADRLVSGAAWGDFCDRLRAAGNRLLDDDFPHTARDRAEGYRHLTRMMTFALQWAAEFGDPDFPAFVRTTDDAVKWGGPNADNRNLRARVDGTGTYRITGNVGTAYDVLFTASEGDMALGRTGVPAERSASDLDVGADGSVELVVSGTEHPGNWLPMSPGTRRVQIRQYFTDWATQEPGWYAIERLDRDEVVPPPLTAARMATALDEAAEWVERGLVYWNDYSRDVVRGDRPPNAIDAPAAQEGGALNIRYGFGWWQLAPDEALVVSFPEPRARYWSLQPYNPAWLEVLDYRDRQTTLNHTQAAVDGDGMVRVVLAHDDPGVPNWLDTEGLPEGRLIYRWTWPEPDVEATAPHCAVVPVAAVRDHLPPATPRVSRDDRLALLRARRTDVARRHRR
jgi:hypothetical protein